MIHSKTLSTLTTSAENQNVSGYRDWILAGVYTVTWNKVPIKWQYFRIFIALKVGKKLTLKN